MKQIKKTIKAWIEFYQSDPNPSIWYKKPTKNEMKNARQFGAEIYPCLITYSITKKSK